MSKPITGYYEATKYLGQFIGQQIPFLQETSCMDPSCRELFAILDFIASIDPNMVEIVKIVKPFFEKLGFARWNRDTVTDMALRKGAPSETETWGEQENEPTNVQDSAQNEQNNK